MSEATAPSWTGGVARAGYLGKGVVYGVIGILAALAAFSTGGETTDSKGAIHAIGQQPFGQVLLGLLALGLLCYALWQFLSAFVDAEGKGSDAKGIAQRTGYFVSGVILCYGIYCGVIARYGRFPKKAGR